MSRRTNNFEEGVARCRRCKAEVSFFRPRPGVNDDTDTAMSWIADLTRSFTSRFIRFMMDRWTCGRCGARRVFGVRPK